MKLGTQVGLGPGHIVLGGDPAPHVYCGQTAGWMKLVLGMEVGLIPGDCVGWGPRSPPQKVGGAPPQKKIGPCLLRPNGWINEAGTWHGGRPQPRRLCWMGTQFSSPKKGGAPSPIFGPFLLWPNGSMHQDDTWYGCWPQRRGLCVRWRPSLLSPTKGAEPPPNFRPISIVPKRLDASRCHSVRR